MFVSKKKLHNIELELMLVKSALSLYVKQVSEVLDQNQSIIDTNRIVIDKLEEILKSKGLE